VLTMVARTFDRISIRNLDFITSRGGMINASMIKDGRNVHFGLLLAKSRKRGKWDGKDGDRRDVPAIAFHRADTDSAGINSRH